jgi:hypothetical protein
MLFYILLAGGKRMPTYNINGSKIVVIRKEEKQGTTILQGVINSVILNCQKENIKNKQNDNKQESKIRESK